MCPHCFRGSSILAVAIAVVSLAQATVFCQGPRAAAQTLKPYTPPRTPSGHPDLQGTYDLATITPLVRPAAFAGKLVLSDEEAAKLEKGVQTNTQQLNGPSRGDRKGPPVGAVITGNGYNEFWWDRGTRVITVNGHKRSSLIVDPTDGRIPPLTAQAQGRNAARLGAGEEPVAADDPERRSVVERCLMGMGSTAGPPALPTGYNNLHQIVQTPDSVMILNEMNHDVRIIRMGAQHLPRHIRKWMGDSVGHWEGDTLVVDTTHFTEKTNFRGSSENLHVIERFTRTDAKTLLYQFTVEDPTTWVKPWTGEYPWPATDDLLYEYACHEGNYGLENILKGARFEEAEAAQKSTK